MISNFECFEMLRNLLAPPPAAMLLGKNAFRENLDAFFAQKKACTFVALLRGVRGVAHLYFRTLVDFLRVFSIFLKKNAKFI